MGDIILPSDELTPSFFNMFSKMVIARTTKQNGPRILGEDELGGVAPPLTNH